MFLSSGARALGLPVTAAAAALSTFLIIDARGAAAYGYVMLIGLLFQMIPFADLGMGAAVASAVAVRDGGEVERRRSDDTLRAAFWLLVCSGSVLLVLVLLLSLGHAWTQLLGIPDRFADDAQWALFVTFIPFAVSLPLGIGQRILLGLGKNHYVNLVAVGGPLVAVGITWLLLHTSIPSLYLAVATPLGVAVVSGACFVVGLRKYNAPLSELLRWSAVRRSTVIDVWRSAGPMLVISIAAPIALQSDRIVLSLVSDGQQLATYSVAAQFYTPTFSLISTAAIALWPIFARETTNAHRQWRRAFWVLVGVGAAAAVLYFVLIQPIAMLLTKNEAAVDLHLALAFAALILVMAAHQPSAMLLTTASGLRFQAVCAVLMLIINLPLSLVFGSLMGAPGPVWASVAATVVVQLVPSLLKASAVARARAVAAEAHAA